MSHLKDFYIKYLYQLALYSWVYLILDSMISICYIGKLSVPAPYDPTQYSLFILIHNKFPLVGVGNPDKVSSPFLLYKNKLSHS